MSEGPNLRVDSALGSNGLAILATWVGYQWGPDAIGYLNSSMTCDEALHTLELFEANREMVRQRAGRVRLTPLDDASYPGLFHAAMEPENGFRWRYRGQTLDPASFAESLHNGTYAQYLVAGKSDRHIYGLVVAYAANPGLGHCYIGFQRSSQRRPQGEMFEGMFLFLRYLFDSNPLRKIYAEIPDYNEQIIGLGKSGLFEEEGRFKDHDFHAGRYYDRRVFACTRQAWDEFSAVVGEWL